MYSVVLAFVNAQSFSMFADGEGQRVYDLLDGLGCIGNTDCINLGSFTPTTACNRTSFLKCDSAGNLAHLYITILCCDCNYNLMIALL
jgi:hypothetical protein